MINLSLARYLRALAAPMLALGALTAHAAPPNEAQHRKLVGERLGNPVDAIHKTPYAGLYEVRVGDDLIYTDQNAAYFFIGRVIGSANHRDYTKERIADFGRIGFSGLPFELAVTTVRGNGERRLAVFEDPNCPYCKRLRQDMEGLDNVTIHTFMYDVLSADSAVKSTNIWCSTDRSLALEDWMLRARAPAPADPHCAAPVEAVLALGKRLKVTGTPTLFLTDGSRITGVVDMAALEQKLAASQQLGQPR